MTSCPHRSELEKFQPPKLSQSVHREECTQCFDNQVNAVVRFVDRLRPYFRRTEIHHASIHVSRSGHSFTLNIKRTPKSKPPSRGDQEPPTKMTKLAIMQEREEDKWEHHTSLKCWKCYPVEGKEILASVDTESWCTLCVLWNF
ncbi:hypothetical protein EDD17DRAFT_939157 [Pisolithus thermaeus]|nr:hypothetical protein EDD17DRAFT_939157 [Pisolithus thermaeus]